tara:strand:+ start:401 stop:709 length:309 start_codon:yes stop_codon:yes gene_type:complete
MWRDVEDDDLAIDMARAEKELSYAEERRTIVADERKRAAAVDEALRNLLDGCEMYPSAGPQSFGLRMVEDGKLVAWIPFPNQKLEAVRAAYEALGKPVPGED